MLAIIFIAKTIPALTFQAFWMAFICLAMYIALDGLVTIEKVEPT